MVNYWFQHWLWISQLSQLSLPSPRYRKMSSNPHTYMDYGGGDY